MLLLYSREQGASGNANDFWPNESKMTRGPYPILVVFAHPHCPCSAATIGELERLLPYLKEKVDIRIAFIQPHDRGVDWVKGDLWSRASAIPGVEVIIDRDGKEADLFDARTSGHTYLYDAGGKLVFSGGITPSRGHMGDSLGRKTILSWLETGVYPLEKTKVFGCSLRSADVENQNRSVSRVTQ